MTFLYRVFVWLCVPFIPLYLRARVRAGKEDASRVSERYGKASIPRPEAAPVLWVHAASMGEVQSVMPFMRELHQRYPHHYILLTTVTITSARHFTKQLPERAFHQFAPLDTEIAVGRFLRHWKPAATFFVDSELWPNMLRSLKKQGAPVVLLNGRLSHRSARRWRMARGFCASMLQTFTYIFAKSERDAERFKALGAPHPLHYGNLKFAAAPLPTNLEEERALADAIGDRYLWLAASTHAGEEIMVAQIHDRLKESFPDVLTIIVPRHATRGDEIVKDIKAQFDMNIAQRSLHQPLSDTTDIYIADTMGELGIFYRLSEIVFIGGSLVPHGGQNPLEAARLGCAILYGKYMDNFHEFCDALEQANAARPVQNEKELEAQLRLLMNDHRLQQDMAYAALDMVKQNQHVMENILQEVASIL
jgi:3-deoxy-D-manno-octulosonic-acid transferase